MDIIEMHTLNGPNIYSRRPVIKLTLDLGGLAQRPTRQLNGFNRRLLQLLPSLRSHYCSRGCPGGFVERLEEGTYLGHVVEHVILELLHRCGMEAGYGKTITTARPGQVEVIFEYGSYWPSAYLARAAVKLVSALLAGQAPSLEGLTERVDLIRQRCEPGPSTAAIIAEAKRRDIPVTLLQEGTSLLLLGFGALQKRVQATLTSETGCLAADLAGDKIMTKKLLDRAGIPTPRGEVALSPSQAVEAARRLGVPVVIKPCDANQGKGVSLNLIGSEAVRKAYHLAARYGSRVMVEEYIIGRHYRLLVISGRLVAASRRLPAQVIGDGKHTVAELAEQLNRDPKRGIGHARPLTKIKLDQEVKAVLARQGKSVDYLPRPGETVLLRENANLSTGGTAWDVTFKVHPDNAALAVRAASIIGLDVAGIDLVAPDLAEPVKPGSGAVIEVNAAPGIRMHLYPSRGRGRNVAAMILAALFPGDDTGRIPVVSITGTNGKTTTARLVAHMIQQTGKTVGLTTTEGVFIGGRPVYKGDTTGPRSARMVLDDPSVEAAVLETARGGIIRDGLGYDKSDVAVVTNISADHLGQDDLETIEDLVFVKSLLVEAVRPGGAVVLNADDPNVLKMIPRARAPVTLFTLKEDNLVFLRHLAAGGKGLTVRDSALFWVSGSEWVQLLPVRQIPLTFNGLAVHHLQNAMAAAAAALSLNLPRETVVQGLETFRPTSEQNPGRGNIFILERGRALLDYGHNPAALEATLQFASRIGCRRLIGVVGVPGDRSDDLIRLCGQACAPYLDKVIFKEDLDLRGRPPGETARLLREGYLRSHPSSRNVHTVLDELKAVELGLRLLDRNDLLVIFYEHRKPIEKLLLGRLKASDTSESVFLYLQAGTAEAALGDKQPVPVLAPGEAKAAE
jgi:cyanophycin synthetase